LRVGKFSAHPLAHSRHSLAVRGQFLHAFGGQAIFVALALLSLGSYILGDEFANPVQAQSAGLLLAAVLIAASVSLVYSLFHPARKVGHRIIVRQKPISPRNERGFAVTERQKLAWHKGRKDPFPSHRYVDYTRIRL
jgi:hypothetical protein